MTRTAAHGRMRTAARTRVNRDVFYPRLVMPRRYSGNTSKAPPQRHSKAPPLTSLCRRRRSK